MFPQGVAHYRITAKLGQGGMGEVYRATDSKLGRQVALKILPNSFAADKERLARFGREAQVLASLNHPNIAAIYGLEDSSETKALVLELVEGDTLSERLRRGPLPVEDALEICAQIAEAVEAAHEKGIIHRDLKPGNVKLTPDAKVKVLDFGLAKLVTDRETKLPLAAPDDSPTITSTDSVPGMILGTAAYMSPEQSTGKPLDKRTDIWSFGCVLYECLTGKRAFAGETATDSIGAVLHKEPDWTALPPETPASIQLLLRKCLAKDRKHRLHDIADARVDLEHALADPGTSSMRLARAAVAEGKRRRGTGVWLGALPWVVALAAVGFALVRRNLPPPGRDPGSAPVVQTYALSLHPDAPLATAGPLGASVVISPDCSKVVYVGRKHGLQGLYWKRITDAEFMLIPDSAKAYPSPVFSPQSDRLAFCRQGGEISLFSFQGGLPRKICQASSTVVGAQWSVEDRILFATKDGIFTVDAIEGSTPTLLILTDKSAGETSLCHPQFMPGGKGLIFTVAYTNRPVSLQTLDLTTKTRKKIELTGSRNPLYYQPTGHLLYGRDDVLWARRFDPVKLAFTGTEFSLLKDVGRDWAVEAHQFSIANNGTLIYARGHQLDPKYQLVWVRDHGIEEVLPLVAGDYRWPHLAADGKSVVLTRGTLAVWKTVLVNLAEGQPVVLSTGDSTTRASAFAYDGTNVFFHQTDSRELAVLRARADGTGQAEEMYRTKGDDMLPGSISPDGRSLALVFRGLDQADIFLKDLKSADEIRPIANTPAHEIGPRFSPDGRWLAYTADVGDRNEAYVRRVPEGGLPIQISKNGGIHPVWSLDGRKLYYWTDKEIMVVKIKSLEPLELEAPTVFATGRFRYSGLNFGPNYAASSDAAGDRLLLLKSIYEEPEPQGATQVTVMVHFNEFIREQEAAQSKKRATP